MQLVAVDFLPPTVLQQQMMRVSSLLAAGQITPLCSANYSLASVVAAMRLLAQASHVGKVRQLVSVACCCLNIILVPSACLPLQGRAIRIGDVDDCVGGSHSIYTMGGQSATTSK
jgi:hypothetical protein